MTAQEHCSGGRFALWTKPFDIVTNLPPRYQPMAKRTLRKLLRDSRGAKSLDTFAKEVQVSKATLFYLENGQRRPSVATLQKLGRVLGRDWRDLAELAH